MSEEEKRALEFFKNNLEDVKELGKKYGFHEEIKNNEILLNYIDRLQKELEQEKEINYEIKNLLENTPKELLDKAVAINNTIGFIKDNFIEKDKIKDKIDQIIKEHSEDLADKNLDLDTKNIRTHQYNAIRSVLEELLKGNNNE